MIKAAFEKIMSEYPLARKEEFTGHPLAEYIRNEVPSIFKSYLPQYSNYIWDASPGQGRWADAPWIAVFNPLVTESAQRGYYPVYLFSNSLNTVSLSMNQGMTDLRKELGTRQARDTLSNRAGIIREKVAPYLPSAFGVRDINLEPTGSQTRLAFYEPGHAFGKTYKKESLPSTYVLVSDLQEMLWLYNFLTGKGGTEVFDVYQPVVDEKSSNLTLEESQRIRFHKRIERNQKLAKEAKKIHGYSCQVCGFNFIRVYGPLGENYIEAHHLTPISKLPEGKTVSLSPQKDFRVVCANCHRMLHRKDAPEDFEEFIKLYKSINKK